MRFPVASNKAPAVFRCYFAFLGADIDRTGLHMGTPWQADEAGEVMRLAMHYATLDTLRNGDK
jgi:hypothetical protein